MARLVDDLNLLEKTLPDASRSRKQQYRLTAKGKKIVQSSMSASSKLGGSQT
jgi:hypothetical protein